MSSVSAVVVAAAIAGDAVGALGGSRLLLVNGRETLIIANYTLEV